MQRRMRRISLITMGSALGAFAIASLIVGLVLRDTDPGISFLLIIFGSLLTFAAAIPFVTLVIAERVQPPALSTGQRRGMTTYLRVSRYVRGGVEAGAGAALIVAGTVTLVGGATFGVWILLIGIVLGLIAAGNFWIARQIRLASPIEDPPAEQLTEH